MYVDHLSDRFVGHGRALNVPSWPPTTPCTGPCRLTGFASLPQCEMILAPLRRFSFRQRAFAIGLESPIILAPRLKPGVAVPSRFECINVKVH
jgi:hypothetical protein